MKNKKDLHSTPIDSGLEMQSEERFKESELYTKVSINYLKSLNTLCCDLFIKISDEKFIKLFNSGEKCDESIVDKYIKKNITVLYVEKINYDKFISFTHEVLAGALTSNSKESSSRQNIETQILSIELIHNISLEIGITSRVAEMVNTSVQNNLNFLCNSNKQLFSLLNDLVQQKSFLYGHAILTSNIACMIADHLNWGSKFTFEKLSMAALLHDVTLTEEQALAHDLKQNEDALSEGDKQKILAHPQKITAMIQSSSDFVNDVDNIILNHHELPDSTGYPRAMSALEISQISCVFILAEALANQLYISKKQDFSLHTQYLSTNYNKGNYKKPLEALMAFYKP